MATVLFTHLEGREQYSGQPDRWREMVERLRTQVQKNIGWFRGREVDMIGVRPLAIFDGPARAIRCAWAIQEAAARLGLQIRAGLHTGECDMVDGRVAGIAAEIGVQVANRAVPGEVLVSNTVKDLVAGSGITFQDRGSHRFDAPPGDWQLFAVKSVK